MTPFLHGLLWFCIGAFVGACIGLFVAGMCAAAGRNAPEVDDADR